MPGSKHITESAILDFLEGAGTGNEQLDALLTAMATLRPSAALHDDLIALLAATAGTSASAPTTSTRTSRARPLPPRWRRRAAFGTILSSIAGKIAIATVALATTTGGLAATGALPDPAQQVVSDVAARIGISVPAPDDHGGDTPATAGASEGPTQLSEQASDTAKKVIEFIFGDDSVATGVDFGREVAETASNSKSNSGGEGHGSDNAPGEPPDKVPAGPPSDQGGGTPASPSSPRP